ncbi:MAG: hypothetical protein HY721_11285 [Planctomycetes bacterium]|nr:hypothetical protein [Planctomycetota bacterium]
MARREKETVILAGVGGVLARDDQASRLREPHGPIGHSRDEEPIDFAGREPPGIYPECEPTGEPDCAASPGCA